MAPMRRALVAVALLAAGCAPLESIDRFDGEFAAAHGQRRLLALVSPS